MLKEAEHTELSPCYNSRRALDEYAPAQQPSTLPSNILLAAKVFATAAIGKLQPSTQAFMLAVGSPTDVAMLTMKVAAGEGERIV